MVVNDKRHHRQFKPGGILGGWTSMLSWLCAVSRVQRQRDWVGGSSDGAPPSTVRSAAEICPLPVKNNERLNPAGYYKVS